MTEQQKFEFAIEIRNAIEEKYDIITGDITDLQLEAALNKANINAPFTIDVADKAYVDGVIDNLIGGADSSHDTLKELYDAIVQGGSGSDELPTQDEVNNQINE